MEGAKTLGSNRDGGGGVNVEGFAQCVCEELSRYVGQLCVSGLRFLAIDHDCRLTLNNIWMRCLRLN